MPPCLRPIRLGLAALALLLVSVAAVADDWPQFRHDGLRSAYSRDPIPVRLTELWNWDESSAASAGLNVKLAASSRPHTPAMVWNGRLFVVSMENRLPFLVCADAKSGLRLWQQPLSGWAGCRPEAGPAVTRSGIVYAYDTIPLTERQVHYKEEQVRLNTDPAERRRLPTVMEFPANHVRIRAFDATTGRPLAEHPLPAAWPRRQFNGLITRIYPAYGPGLSMALAPGRASHWGLGEFPALGPALLIGDQLQAASVSDFVVRWQPGGPAEIVRFSDNRGFRKDLATPAELQGFPLVQSPNGAVLADDKTRRFLGVLGTGRRVERFDTADAPDRPGGGTTLRWSRELDWTIGIPTAAGDVIAVGLGGQSAQNAIVGFSPEDGAPRWAYPRLPLVDPRAPLEDRWVTPLINLTPVSPDEGFAGAWLHRPRHGLANPAPPPKKPLRISPFTDDHEILIQRWESVSGQRKSLGLVSTAERVYGVVGGALVALEAATGRLIWNRPQRRGTTVEGFVGVRDHLIVCQNNGADQPRSLLGIARDTGKLEWVSPVTGPGQMAVAGSLLYYSQAGALSAWAPAERTFRMAVDSHRVEDYERDPLAVAPTQAEVDGVAEEPKPAVAQPEPFDAPGQPAEPKGLGDTGLVRLRWGTPAPEMLALIRQRQRLAPSGRLLVSLDWLNATRSERLNAGAPGGWSEAEIIAFAQTAAAIAAEAKPEHFEIGSEVNVYLARHPGAIESVRGLIRATRAAVKRASRDTKVLVSFNCEVLSGFYGRTKYFPFGVLPEIKSAARAATLSLSNELEVVGLTIRPQSGFIQARQIGPNYLPARRAELGGKPVVITHLEAWWDNTDSAAISQTRFLKRMFQLLYWLDVEAVAYPDITGASGAPTADVRLRNGPARRPAMAEWKSVLGWKWVEDLTAQPPPVEKTSRR